MSIDITRPYATRLRVIPISIAASSEAASPSPCRSSSSPGLSFSCRSRICALEKRKKEERKRKGFEWFAAYFREDRFESYREESESNRTLLSSFFTLLVMQAIMTKLSTIPETISTWFSSISFTCASAPFPISDPVLAPMNT